MRSLTLATMDTVVPRDGAPELAWRNPEEFPGPMASAAAQAGPEISTRLENGDRLRMVGYETEMPGIDHFIGNDRVLERPAVAWDMVVFWAAVLVVGVTWLLLATVGLVLVWHAARFGWTYGLSVANAWGYLVNRLRW